MIFSLPLQSWVSKLGIFFCTPSITLSLRPELLPVLLKFQTGDSMKINTSKFDKDQIRLTNLIRLSLKIEIDSYKKSGKLQPLLIFIDLYCGSLSIFIDLIDLSQNKKLETLTFIRQQG